MRALFLGSLFIVGLLFCVEQAEAAPLIYDARSCTPGVDCNVGSHGTSPGLGPSNADFQAFYGAQLGMDLSADTFTWTEASNGNGYTFGHVDDTDAEIHTAYLWTGSTMLCCTLDDPYAIADGNDHNHFIGADVYGVSNAGQPLYPAFLAGPGGPDGLVPINYMLSPQAITVIGDAWETVVFVAIDDWDNVLATWHGPTGWLELDSEFIACCSAPEPASLLLLIPALVLARRFKARS